MRYIYRFLSLVLVSFLLIVPLSYAYPVQFPASVGSDFGVCSNIASRYPDAYRLDDPVTVTADLGVGWVREDFQFSRIEPVQGKYEWFFHDKTIEKFTQQGIHVIGLLGGPTPGWATPGNPANDFYPPDPVYFAAFVKVVVARYKGQVHYWEIWNEPDHPWYWKPQPDIAAYTNLLKAAYAAVKESDPTAMVLSSGIVSPEPAMSFLKSLADHGGWNSFDILSLHPYTDPKSPEAGQIATAGLGQVQAMAEKLGKKPIWVTEFGWSTGLADRIEEMGHPVDEETQANYLIRGMVLLRSAGAERVLSYNLKDTQAGRNFYGVLGYGAGLVDYDRRKPSFIALQTLNQQLRGATPQGMINLSAEQVILDFEHWGDWKRGNQPNGTLTQSSSQRHTGSSSAALSYAFSSGDNDYVVFMPNQPPMIEQASQIGVWVAGDSSGHALKMWLRDSQGETLQFRLGFVGGSNWQYLSTPTSGQVEWYNVIRGSGNGQLDFPVQLVALVLDDEPDRAVGAGTIYLDDITATSGPEAYGARFAKNGQHVDVLWSPQGATVPVWTNSAQGTLINRNGQATTITSSQGAFHVQVGESPIYLVHQAAAAPPPPEPTNTPRAISTPETLAEPTPSPLSITPIPSDGQQACFSETGYCMSGRIGEYWHQHGGLPVFGYPIGPQQQEMIEGKPYQVQWFERNRLELHPENDPPYDVLLGRLSEEILQKQGRIWQQQPKGATRPECRFFPETQFQVCGDILETWHTYGLEIDGEPGKSEQENVALFGLPLGNAAVEHIQGKEYLVQWFERARFEVHPELEPPYRVLFGLLGNEMKGRK